MNVYTVLCLCFLANLAVAKNAVTHRNLKTDVQNKNEIVIPVMVHVDDGLSKRISREQGFKNRRKIKGIIINILKDANVLLKTLNSKKTVILKMIDTKFLRNTTIVPAEENATNYLKSYCKWQSRIKMMTKTKFFSVLLTELDLFYVRNGQFVRSSSARSYINGICSVAKSCSIIEWEPKNMGYLLAHEVGHSLGIHHDGYPYHKCRDSKAIMEPSYKPAKHPTAWSPCSREAFERFLKNRHSWCLRS